MSLQDLREPEDKIALSETIGAMTGGKVAELGEAPDGEEVFFVLTNGSGEVYPMKRASLISIDFEKREAVFSIKRNDLARERAELRASLQSENE